MQTRKLVLSLAAVLVLALVAPVVGQPFADVPTAHWAYDAIAELAAKGLVEGFPDGTFKGNQPMTRYEMAMIVARIIARIEAIPTPPPLPPDLVRRPELTPILTRLGAAEGRLTTAERRIGDAERTIATLMRLVSEFRAELQALGVRVTALEEELSALRARLDNTRITGDFNWRYETIWGTFTVPGLGLTVPFGSAGFLGLQRVRLTYSGTVAPGVSVALRARYAGNGTVDFDRLHLDWANALGLEGLRVRLGRQVLTLGPVGLLLDQAAHNARRDGLSVAWKLGTVDLQVGAQWAALTSNTSASVYSGRIAFPLLPGVGLGVNVRVDADPAVPAGQGTGVSGDLTAELLAGVSLRAEYVSYNAPNAPPPTTRNFWFARLDLHFGRLSGGEVPFDPRLAVWYKDFDDAGGTPFAPLTFGGAPFAFGDAYFGNNVLDLGLTNLRGWGARLDTNLAEGLRLFLTYENYDGKTVAFNVNIWSAGLSMDIAPRTTLDLYYSSLNGSLAGVSGNAQGAALFLRTSW